MRAGTALTLAPGAPTLLPNVYMPATLRLQCKQIVPERCRLANGCWLQECKPPRRTTCSTIMCHTPLPGRCPRATTSHAPGLTSTSSLRIAMPSRSAATYAQTPAADVLAVVQAPDQRRGKFHPSFHARAHPPLHVCVLFTPGTAPPATHTKEHGARA